MNSDVEAIGKLPSVLAMAERISGLSNRHAHARISSMASYLGLRSGEWGDFCSAVWVARRHLRSIKFLRKSNQT